MERDFAWMSAADDELLLRRVADPGLSFGAHQCERPPQFLLLR